VEPELELEPASSNGPLSELPDPVPSGAAPASSAGSSAIHQCPQAEQAASSPGSVSTCVEQLGQAARMRHRTTVRPTARYMLAMASPAHLVIGTAGHIDHGKTSLVRALTGVDLDRLPEEKARGITIALGFTWLDLPNDRRLAFVDVPGHERLVRTMVAGATGLDAVMLCVSAAEGVMPQTREHLDILDLLGVQHGLVALTMTDLVDEEMIELATMDVEEAVEGTFLEGAPIILTAAGPEPAGLEALRSALAALPQPARVVSGPFRHPVDRAFVERGFGTIVTGTVRSGAVQDGDEVEVLPQGVRTRIRGLQVHAEKADTASAGQRAALNLAGVERDDLHRGSVVVHPGTIPLASILDIAYRHLPDAPTLTTGTRGRLLVGTAEVMGVITVIDTDTDTMAPGWSGFVQVRTDSPVVALPGDRAILRRESPVQTIGGGRVLDPWAPRARRRDISRAYAELIQLRDGDPLAFLERAGDAGLSAADARLRGVSGGRVLADRVLHPDRVQRLEGALLVALATFHAERPLAPGAPKRELHRAPVGHLPTALYEHLVQDLANRGALVLDGPRMRLPAFRVVLNADETSRSETLESAIRAAAFEGPTAKELVAKDPELIHLLLESGALVRVGERLLHRDRLDELELRVVALLRAQQQMSPADFKDLTGLSRRHAIPLLEWLDARRVTIRSGDVRVLRQG
jgi:selenocysteine-specific elongation factor